MEGFRPTPEGRRGGLFRIGTCRNEVEVASILFVSFICTSEQRTPHLEVASSSGMLSTRSPTLALDAPADDGRGYSGVLHEDVELMRVGESVGC